MPDTKISAMPAAANVVNADDIPLVHAGVNLKTSRALLLHGGLAEDIALSAHGFNKARLMSASGGEFFEVGDTFGQVGQITIGLLQTVVGTAAFFQITNTGGIQLNAVGGPLNPLLLGDSAGNLIAIPGAAGQIVFVAAAGVFVPFLIQVPGAIGNWVGPVPADYNLAINRLAAAVAGLLGGPIP